MKSYKRSHSVHESIEQAFLGTFFRIKKEKNQGKTNKDEVFITEEGMQYQGW